MSADWRELPVSDESGEQVSTLGEVLAELRSAAMSGEARDAFDDGVQLAFELHTAGLDREALSVLDELSSFVTPSTVEPERWPWLLNTRGMALSGLGRLDDAEAAYREMRRLAELLPPGPIAQDLASTASQNQGIVALEAGDARRAVELLREALPVKVELEDFVSAVDVLNSLALAVAEVGDLDEADRMLSSVERLSNLLQDPRRLGAAYGNRGILRTRRGDFVGAEEDFRAALRFARAEHDPLRELLGVLNVGSSLADQGRHGQALRWYRRGARWAHEIGASVIEIRFRRSVSLMLLRMRRVNEASSEMQVALELARDLEHARYTAECRADAGALHIERGATERAEAELRTARDEFIALGDQRWEGQVLRNLAELKVRSQEIGTADELWTAAMQVLADEPGVAMDVARRAAEAWVEHGDVGTAQRWVSSELALAERLEQGAALAWRMAMAGALLNERSGTETGLQLLQRATERYEQLGDRRQATRVRLDVATALSDLGRHVEAIDELARCLEFADEHSDRVLRQHALANTGEIARREGRLQPALAAMEEALQLARDLADDDATAHVLGNLGLARTETGELDAARAAFAEQLRIARALHASHHEALALGGLGNLDFIASRYRRAAARYRRAANLNEGLSIVGEVEDLGGWLESAASAGMYDDLQQIAQRRVDAAQAAGMHGQAAAALSRSARVLLRAGERDAAADLYSAATQIHLTQANDGADFETEIADILTQTLGMLALHIQVDLPEPERQPFYEAVLADLDEAEEGLGERLRPYLVELRSLLIEEGVVDRLRQGEDPKGRR